MNEHRIDLDIPEHEEPKRKFGLMRILLAVAVGLTSLGLAITYYMNRT